MKYKTADKTNPNSFSPITLLDHVYALVAADVEANCKLNHHRGNVTKMIEELSRCIERARQLGAETDYMEQFRMDLRELKKEIEKRLKIVVGAAAAHKL